MLTPADEIHHINKHNFKVPFVCGCRDLGEALRRVAEGAAMIRTKVGSLMGALQVPVIKVRVAFVLLRALSDCCARAGTCAAGTRSMSALLTRSGHTKQLWDG